MCQLLIHLGVQVKVKRGGKREFDAEIITASKSDIKKLQSGWKFNWLELYSLQSKFYKVDFENEVQGLIKLEKENDSYYVLKNIEVSPENYGSEGQFKNIAELLISYACLKSFELNLGHYRGYLVFTSKGTLIEYYQKKYQAQLIFRERMIISPEKGRELILKNLKIDLDDE